MTFEERVNKSETKLFKAVFPEITNHHNTMHGGEAMKLMDEIAFITATRYSRQAYVTVGSERVNYNNPLPAGTIIEVIGRVAEVGNTSMKVSVKIYIEELYSDSRIEAVDAIFTLVAIDENKRPIKII